MSRAPEEHPCSESASVSRIRSLWIAAFIAGLAGAFVPKPEFRYGFFMLDTFMHLVIFAILAFMPMILFRNRRTTFLLAISMAPVGYLLENFHMMMTGESFNAINALANNAGVLVGIAAGFFVRLKLHYEREPLTTEADGAPGDAHDDPGRQFNS